MVALGYSERSSILAPAYDAQAIVKSDITILDMTKALWVGGLGDVVVTMGSGRVATFNAVPAGTKLEIQVTQVRAATTATNILALY